LNNPQNLISDDKDTKMIGQVTEVKNRVSDARKNIKEIDSKMGQIDDKTAFVNLELERLRSDKGNQIFKN
jgi:regulator of replication initiation timing